MRGNRPIQNRCDGIKLLSCQPSDTTDITDIREVFYLLLRQWMVGIAETRRNIINLCLQRSHVGGAVVHDLTTIITSSSRRRSEEKFTWDRRLEINSGGVTHCLKRRRRWGKGMRNEFNRTVCSRCAKWEGGDRNFFVNLGDPCLEFFLPINYLHVF